MNSVKGKRKRKDKLENGDLEINEENLSDLIDDNKKMKTLDNGASINGCADECFYCKTKDEDLTKCSLKSCDKMYHRKCLDKLPSVKSEPGLCPHHVCVTCFNANPKNPQVSKGNILSCSKCPVAFHDKETCSIPGSVISSKGMICPKHFEPEESRNYPAVKHLPFCVECCCNEELVFCKSCPTAIHITCRKIKTIMTDYICDRCVSKKIVSFNDVVWAKVYDFRWWPAVVVNPNDVPDAVRNIKHFDGEFPVKFFGVDEYFWVQMGRVYPFFYKKFAKEDKLYFRHNFKKVIKDPDFDEAVQLALNALSNNIKFQSAEAANNKKPPPYKHVKSNRPIGNVQIYTLHDVSDYNTCGCKVEDPNPCGYDSMCLNRSMCTECHENICEAGDKCQNQKFQKSEYPLLKPFWTVKRGWGLKCLEDIKKGHFVNEYCGDLIDEEECERRIKQKQIIGDTNFYFCTLDSTRIIDAGPKGNFSRFMNHSCEPNCETQKWMVLGDARVGIFAKKDIPAGSELTFDYQMDFSYFEKLKCNCGSKKCSGLIGKKPQSGVYHSSAQEDKDLPDENGTEDVGENGKEKKSSKLEKSKVAEHSKKQNGSAENSRKQNGSPEIFKKQNGTSENSKKQNGTVEQSRKQNGTAENSKKQNGTAVNSKKQNGTSEQSKKRNETVEQSKKQNGIAENSKKQNGNVDKSKKQNGSKKDKAVCFKCKTGGKMIVCSQKECSKPFHVRCLRPGFGAKDEIPAKWSCPVHFCKKCNESSTYQCYTCPNSFCDEHVRFKSKSKRFACPKHYNDD